MYFCVSNILLTFFRTQVLLLFRITFPVLETLIYLDLNTIHILEPFHLVERARVKRVDILFFSLWIKSLTYLFYSSMWLIVWNVYRFRISSQLCITVEKLNSIKNCKTYFHIRNKNLYVSDYLSTRCASLCKNWLRDLRLYFYFPLT